MTIALEAINLNKNFGGIQVTQNINLQIHAGERRLIIGPNGAGKTTLFNQITGELKPSSGCIKVFGKDVTALPPHLRPHMGLSRTFQIINLFNQDSALHNIALALFGVSPRRFNPFRQLKPSDPVYERAHAVLKTIGLEQSAYKRVGEMSYGEQRRIEIGLAMSQSPKLLLLDEPLAGLSHDERIWIRDLISTIPKSTTIVMIEHDMDVALAFAEKITLLHYGRLIVEGDRDTVVNHPQTKEIYLGK
jgi:branched-chain amino acid transport system ATP-binding protein